MKVTLLRNNPERLFVIQALDLDAESAIRNFSRNDEGVWNEPKIVDESELSSASSEELKTSDAIAFLKVISKFVPDALVLAKNLETASP